MGALWSKASKIYGDNTEKERLSKQHPKRVDLRLEGCVPYLPVEDQGNAVSCVAHAFGVAYYCSLRRVGSGQNYEHPKTTEMYLAALSDGGQEGKGVSFPAVQRQFSEKHSADFLRNSLNFVELENSVDDAKGMLLRGFPIVVGYQVNATIERFHKSISACKEHGYILPSFRHDPTPTSGHTVLIIGYDDALDGFIGRNSWGTGWGADGHFLIRYEDLADEDFFTDLAAIVPAKN